MNRCLRAGCCVRSARWVAAVALLALTHATSLAYAQETDVEREIAELRERLEALEAERGEPDEVRTEAAPPTRRHSDSRDVWARDMGPTRVRLMDLAVDLLMSAGSSSEKGETLAELQGGAHDPNQRGFSFNQLELSTRGAVDPYFTAQAFIIFQIDREGETTIELEEAFFTTQALPFGLQNLGFLIEGGTFFTDFGRMNPTHPHFWDFIDQPIVNTRFLGGDGLRGPGAVLAWLAPLPWFSEFRFSWQNAKGETQVSFLANDEVYEERPIGGRPFVEQDVRSFRDFTYLLRWANGFDITDTWNAQLGASAAFGPNATVRKGSSQIYGADAVAKWTPLEAERGWPFLKLQAEFMYRDFEADAFSGDTDDGPVSLPRDVLKDWGLYAYGVWGFHRGWAAALRYEYAKGGDGPSYDGNTPVGIADDPFRSKRHRVSPMLAFHPSEFSRLRLQYNYDRADFVPGRDVHTVWFGVDLSFGAHPAHTY